KISGPHFHASGKRRRHGVDARDELGKKQGLFATAVKILRRAQNASFRIRRKPAQQAQQRPSANSSREIENDVAADHRQGANPEHEIEMQISVGRDRASGQESERSRQWKADGLRKAHYRQKQVTMVGNQ